ncbi:hypothetical protein PG994_003255 [Apiospora phragmitis]|uniref:Uncharacterized protein n=1 Tax=Apiospora phragmitis TaxID=2905665 RepID=A0ABR1VXN0_9PEZI
MTMPARTAAPSYHDDSSSSRRPLEHLLYPPLDLKRGFALDWRRDIVLLDLEAGTAVWRWHPHGLPKALSRAAHVVVLHDHLRGGVVGNWTWNWMHRVVAHFGPRLRGLWFVNRVVWRQVERALLRIPWENSHRNNSGSGVGEDGEATTVDGVDPWDVLVKEG